jgi:hypothetical protein
MSGSSRSDRPTADGSMRDRAAAGRGGRPWPTLDWWDWAIRVGTAAVAAFLVWLLVYFTSPFVPSPPPPEPEGSTKSGFGLWRSPWPRLEPGR